MAIDTPAPAVTVPLRVAPAARSQMAIARLRPLCAQAGIPLPRNTDFLNVATLVAAQDKGVDVRSCL